VEEEKDTAISDGCGGWFLDTVSKTCLWSIRC
jgi:hypothetical protein